MRDDRHARAAELLARHLLEAHGADWPGADGLTVEDVLRDYPQALAHGLVPGLEELARQYPELADELANFLAVPAG
jgi:hypothetical protein